MSSLILIMLNHDGKFEILDHNGVSYTHNIAKLATIQGRTISISARLETDPATPGKCHVHQLSGWETSCVESLTRNLNVQTNPAVIKAAGARYVPPAAGEPKLCNWVETTFDSRGVVTACSLGNETTIDLRDLAQMGEETNLVIALETTKGSVVFDYTHAPGLPVGKLPAELKIE